MYWNFQLKFPYSKPLFTNEMAGCDILIKWHFCLVVAAVTLMLVDFSESHPARSDLLLQVRQRNLPPLTDQKRLFCSDYATKIRESMDISCETLHCLTCFYKPGIWNPSDQETDVNIEKDWASMYVIEFESADRDIYNYVFLQGNSSLELLKLSFDEPIPFIPSLGSQANFTYIKIGPNYFAEMDLFGNLPYSKLKKLMLNSHRINKINNDSLSKFLNIKAIHFDNNNISEAEPYSFHNHSNLKWLYVENNYLKYIPEHFCDNLPALVGVRLRNNKIEYISENAFNGVPSLTLLNLEGNFVFRVSDFMIRSQALHSPLKRLVSNSDLNEGRVLRTNIIWNGSYINYIFVPSALDKRIHTHRYMHSNNDSSDSENYSKAGNFEFVNLEFFDKQSRISCISLEVKPATEGAFKHVLVYNVTETSSTVNLTGVDPYTLRYRKKICELSQHPNFQHYQISSLEQTILSEETVFLTETPLPLSLPWALGLIGIVGCVVCVLVYHQRWRLWIKYYKITKWLRKRENHEEAQQHEFDGCFSYADNDEDENWVKELVRDFRNEDIRLYDDENEHVGRFRFTSIVEKITSSRNMIVILSRRYWTAQAEFELEVATDRLLEGRLQNIIVIKTENLRPMHVPLLLESYMAKKKYLEWGNRRNPVCRQQLVNMLRAV